MGDKMELEKTDSDMAKVIKDEINRQRNSLELIASENFVSGAILEVMGSVLTNKYSEGYPGRRYYGGNEFIDAAENMAIERAKKLFGAEHVNVQPYSGSPANHAAYFALLNIGDSFMGMDLGCGGHLTHGSPVNFSGRQYNCVPYFVDKETSLIDMDHIRNIAKIEKPKMVISSLTAYPRTIDFKAFQEICEEVDAYHFADISHIAGLVAAGVHPSPLPFTDVVTTTTHKTLRGPRGAIIMCRTEDRLHDKYHPNSRKNLAQMIDSAVFPGLQGGPHDNINAAKAVALGEALRPEFREYQRQIVKNAKTLADELMSRGFNLVTGGTDNHLMLADLRNKGITGKEAETALNEVGIVVNKNMIPFDQRTPFDPSGIRIGTPAITTRGMKESEMKLIAELISKILKAPKNGLVMDEVKEQISELCDSFPLYPFL